MLGYFFIPLSTSSNVCQAVLTRYEPEPPVQKIFSERSSWFVCVPYADDLGSILKHHAALFAHSGTRQWILQNNQSAVVSKTNLWYWDGMRANVPRLVKFALFNYAQPLFNEHF